MKSLTLKQYTITIGVSTFGDLEEAKDIAETLLDALNPTQGFASSVRVTENASLACSSIQAEGCS